MASGDKYLYHGGFTRLQTFPVVAIPFLPDGRPLCGNAGHMGAFVGEKKARIYDPINDTWEVVPDMNAGRWYPSNVTLANGDVVVMGGTTSSSKDVNTLTRSGSPTATVGERSPMRHSALSPTYADLYPGPFSAKRPGLRHWTTTYGALPDVLGAGRWIDGPSSSLSYRDYGSAVMFGNGKIMIVGGNPRDYNEASPTITPSASVEIIDLNADNRSWRTAQSICPLGERHHIATALPDGKGVGHRRQ